MTTVSDERKRSNDHLQVFLYFGALIFLIAFVNPIYFLTDIPTSYMLKNQLHANADQVSLFRWTTGIPAYFAFVFGLTRDRWNPLGMRDRGLLVIFGPLTGLCFVWLAFQHVTYTNLYIGMLLVMLSSRMIVAAYQGLITLIAQEKMMSGRLATLWNVVAYLPFAAGAWLGGQISSRLTPMQIFASLAVLSALIGVLGFWKPRAVFTHAYDQPEASTSNFWQDVRRLFSYRAIYPAVLIMYLWNFAPGFNTPLQYYFSNTLRASDEIYADFQAIFTLSFIPTLLIFGWLCKRYPLRKLLL
ncbi:MAG TPA: MFS transporter [Fimbriimonas sp.]|nr:MFS transporter [Fimbriimonas sp.]